MVNWQRAAATLPAVLVLAVVGCSATPAEPVASAAETGTRPPASTAPETAPPPSVAKTENGTAREGSPSPTPTPTPTPTAAAAHPDRGPRASAASLSIPSIGIRNLRVVPYRGTADDLPGTRIQDRGIAASPRGRRGGVRPGQVGNLIVTAHRTSAGGPFGRLPSVRRGTHILVASGGLVHDYEVTRTMMISFRSERSRARQSAPVPGQLGTPAQRPMITLSTCATPEDHARGNYWSDALGNPEHRIAKVGVLVDVRPA